MENNKQSLLRILDTAAALRMNAIYFQVRPEGDAFYDSKIEPWSVYLTGQQGKPPSPFWDPLQFAVEEAHKRNLELHAWLNPYRAKANLNTQLAPNHIASRHPEVAYKYGSFLWMDPGSEVVQNTTYDVIIDMATRYDIDGIHFDDYFYPYPVSGVPFPDSATYAAYKAGGGTLGLSDWRRDNVNRLVQRINDGLKKVRPSIKFGISPFGIWKPGHPQYVNGLNAYEELYADAHAWLSNGWLDYLAPQLYWPIAARNQSFPALFNWWTGVSLMYKSAPRHVYSGNALYRTGSPDNWPLTEIAEQVKITREQANSPGTGAIHFSAKWLLMNHITPFMNSSVYPTPALPPVMPWLSNYTPAAPADFKFDSQRRLLQWTKTNEPRVRSYALYVSSGGLWKLLHVLPVSASSFFVSAENIGQQFALRAVSETAVEGAAVFAHAL